MANTILEPKLPRMLLVSNFLSSITGYRIVMENLADRLQQSSRGLICVSSFRSGWIRGAHMFFTAFFRRRNYDLALVDIFSGRGFVWGEALSFLLKILRCPFILILRGGALPDFARKHPQRVKSCLSRATVVVSPSKYLQEQMRSFRSDIHLLANPLDVDAFTYRLRESPKPHLVWLRSFHEMYNPSLAPKVGALLVGDFPNVHLTMVGPDKEDGSLQRLLQVAEDLGFTNRMTLPGGVPQVDVPQWMTKGDIFLNTTNVDNTPVSVLQSMLCGLCVVSTNVGGIPYLLEHEHDALLVPPEDPIAMAAAVRRFLTEPGLADRISRNARKKVEQFDWTIVLPQWKALLASVAQPQKK